MDLDKEYNKLYDHWHREFETAELTHLSEEILKGYKTIVRELNKYNIDQKEELKVELLDSYKNNFNYLLKDFLKIREIKLINNALTLQEINLKDVIEAEKLFYQNLVSAMKGFQRLKAFTLYEDLEKTPQSDTSQEDQQILEKGEEKNIILDQLKEIVQDLPSQSNEIVTEKKVDYNYTLIRFIKKAPPLVGIDLINYGPFEENDIANLPFKNAKILIYEKFAEKIEIP